MIGAALAGGGSWIADSLGVVPQVSAGSSATPPGVGDGGTGEDGRTSWLPTSAPDQEAAPHIAAVPTTSNVPTLSPTPVPAPPIVARADWGADETIRADARQFAPIRKLIVHHTASDNRPADPAAIVRETYADHVQRRGFSDIGYNFLIDHRGVIYEGRFARRYDGEQITGEDRHGWGVVGAHAAHYNHGSCGICLIGNFETGAPTDAALTSLAWLVAWKAGRNRIDVRRADPFENYYGRFFGFPNLGGHRNVGFTLCPGRLLFAALAGVRDHAAQQAGSFPPVVADTPALVRNDNAPTSRTPLPPAAPPQPPTTAAAPQPVSGAASGAATGGSAPAAARQVASAATGRVVGYRALTSAGLVMRTPGAADLGAPGVAVVGASAPVQGDGLATVTASGAVAAFGTVAAAGDAAGKGQAVAIATTRSGRGYWVLMADGGIYPFGEARYFGSPRRSGSSVVATAIQARADGTGYWVLSADGAVRGYGAAASLGTAAGAGRAVGFVVAPSQGGCLVLRDDGSVTALGTAHAAGDLTSIGSPWKRPAVAITGVPDGDGYVISSRDGGLFSFGGAPVFGTFAGSRATVVGLTVACG